MSFNENVMKLFSYETLLLFYGELKVYPETIFLFFDTAIEIRLFLPISHFSENIMPIYHFAPIFSISINQITKPHKNNIRHNVKNENYYIKAHSTMLFYIVKF